MKRATLWAGLLAAVLVQPLPAQTERPAPEVYALTNARIVVAPGRTIERGTVVIRDGRIQAVGAQVRPPADAFRLDLAGLTIYPGLIDAATGFGLPRAAAPTGGPAAAAQQAGRDEAREIRPGRLAWEDFRAALADLEALRAAGITTVGLAYEGGILPGRAVAVSAGSGAASSLVLRAPVAQQVAFGTARGEYPSTLMGSLAYIRQAFLDAAHYRRAGEAFARDPGSVRRPTHSPDTEALAPAATREIPVWIAASRENDIRRAMELGRELGLDYRLLGAQEGYRLAAELARDRRPVLVSLDFPRPAAVTGRTFELAVTPLSGTDNGRATRDTAAVREARANAAVLVRAGVPIALTSHGLTRPADFRERIRQAIDAGLSHDDALRALTITPAQALGMERALGTIEAGKLANLVVVEGADIFARDARFRHIFVEGERFDIRAPTRPQPAQERAAPGVGARTPGAPAPAEAPAVASVAGEWTATASTPHQTFSFTLRLEQEGTRVSGEVVSSAGTSNVAGEITGDRMVIHGQVLLAPELRPIAMTFSGTIQGNQMRGTVEAAEFGTADLAATRSPGGSE